MTKQPSYKIYQSVRDIPNFWDNLGNNIFLSIPYLQAQENALSLNLSVFYVAFYIENELIGKTVFQRLELKGEKLFPQQKNKFSRSMTSILDTNLLCVGNIKLTGENAYELKEGFAFNDIYKPLEQAIKEVEQISSKQKKTVNLVLIKDFYEGKTVDVQSCVEKYTTLSVQPNMVIKIKPTWGTFNDYLNDMRSKYRTRVHRAFKKMEGVEYVEFTKEDIHKYQKEIYQLYQNVLANAEFTPYELPQNYFYSMKNCLADDLKFYAGFLNGKLVCFYTLIHNKKDLEAGFLGYDSELQHDKQLYLNMLYKIIDYGIQHQFNTIILSRSALEIKSSVGAEPIESYGFLKHNNPILNKGIKVLFNKFYTPEEWTPRSPFKG